MGLGVHNPGQRYARISVADAHALATKLLADGWEGVKRKKTNRETGEVTEYVCYIPETEFKFTPMVLLYKPAKGSNTTAVKILHSTHASEKERRFLFDLKRQFR